MRANFQHLERLPKICEVAFARYVKLHNARGLLIQLFDTIAPKLATLMASLMERLDQLLAVRGNLTQRWPGLIAQFLACEICADRACSDSSRLRSTTRDAPCSTPCNC
jgi:hypothetical protein